MIRFLRKGKNMKTVITITILLTLAAGTLYGAAAPPPDSEQIAVPPPPPGEQPEVLTSGPVHEAFAEPVNLQVQGGIVAPNPPPPNIEEVPPPQRPTGEQFVWVPGYWSWDSDRNNYIWVTACWRAAPPNMYWVPGYWSPAPGGWEWVAGFWTPAGSQEIEYLPAPPPFDDMQSLGAPPSPDHIWVPPCQYWYQGHYVRRTGYWLQQQPGWVWVPSHYVWTPRGYIFAAGHWDYALERRGMLFAPVYFPPAVYARPRFSYSPSIIIDIGILRVSMFAYPRYSHYYFGDYYDDAYLRVGIYPCFESQRIHTWYDPIYVYDRWHNRHTEPRWDEHERHEYDVRRADKDLRPPRTYREMEAREARLPEPQRRNFPIAQPLTVAVTNKAASMKFERINAKAQQKIVKQETEVHKFREERNRLEAPAVSQKAVQSAERKAPVTTAPEHREAAVPQAQHNVPAVTPQAERKETTVPQAQPKAPAQMPQVQRKEVVVPPVQHNVPAVTPPAEHRETPAPQAQRKAPVEVPQAEHKESASGREGAVTPAVESTPKFVSPREVRATKAEKVKIGKSPIVGRQAPPGRAEAGSPPKTAEEERQHGNGEKDKNKNKDKDKNK
jgi:hypothetical protein